MKIEYRASFGWPKTAAGYAPCANGLVVHYDGNNQDLANKSHDACHSYWKAIRRYHMDSNGWLDIGYSFAVCPHGYVLEGRGWQHEQAAQPGGNTTWTSVTFMSGDSEKPTTAQVNAFKELRDYLHRKGLSSGLRGHRDFICTSCPGEILYSMVKSGGLTGAPSKEDDVSADEVWDYPIDTGDGKAPWRAKTVLGHLEKEQDDIQAKVNKILELLEAKTSE